MKLEWENVEGAAQRIFRIWVDQPELKWAREAWQLLEKAGLTDYESEYDRHEVCFRFLAMAGVYHDFCDAAWEEMSDVAYVTWAGELGVSDFFVGQHFAQTKAENPICEDEDAVSEAIELLVEARRDEVVQALVSGLGGYEELYESLWRSRFALEKNKEVGVVDPGLDDEDDDDNDYHDDDEEDDDPWLPVDECRLKAWTWVEQGCPSLR